MSRTTLTTNTVDRPLPDDRCHEVWRVRTHRSSPDWLHVIATCTALLLMATIVVGIGPLLRAAGGE